jgi:hypothetical protein
MARQHVVVPAAGRHPRWRESVSTKVDTYQGWAMACRSTKVGTYRGTSLQPTFEGPVRQRLGTRPKRLRNAAAKLLGWR